MSGLLPILIVVGVLLDSPAQAAAETSPAPVLNPLRRGELLARAHCATCHLFPPPGGLDQKTWKEQTLPRMKMRMGLAPAMLDRQKEADIIKQTTGWLKTAPISIEDFELISGYYSARAPVELPPQDPHPEIEVGLAQFQYERPAFRHSNPSTSAVHIDSKRHQIFLGDNETKSMTLLSEKGIFLKTVPLQNVPVQFSPRQEDLWITCIGSFLPTEKRLGGLSIWEPKSDSWQMKRAVLTGLPRTTHVEQADLNGDGRDDLVVCQYGNNIGQFSWFEQMPNGSYSEHILIQKSGAMRAVIRDLNGDKKPDIVVLFAQETEALYVLTNKGGGEFAPPRTLLQRPPMFGHTGFELVDFDRDGRMDFLVTNGDNGEYASPNKKYHGIRLLLDRGDRYHEAFFLPLHGAFRAIARDFDSDGDLDIAAISYYPDYEKTPTESFVYFENDGAGKFRPQTFRECVTGRWLVMDVGDIDGDGDDDIVLGSFIHGPSDVPDFLMLDWEKSGPSAVLLRNRTK